MSTRLTCSIVLLSALLFLTASAAYAQTDYGGANVTWADEEVSGVHYNINTLTINGNVTVADQVALVVTAATINVEGVLSADAAGYNPSTNGLSPGDGGWGGNNVGAGGGGYGGAGGNGSGAAGGPAWGNPDITTEKDTPDEFGSGGGTAFASVGGSGGGAIKLVATGTLTVTAGGEISANGEHGKGPQDDGSGGGAGGSIWLDCDTLAGGGFVTANGGDAQQDKGQGGGGGGGRIAVYYNTDNSGIFYLRGGGSGRGSGTDGADGTLRINGADGPPPNSSYWDHAGFDWTITRDQEVNGVHTNIGTLLITNCTATVLRGEAFSAFATNIIIATNSVLDASGAGGASTDGTGPGNSGGGGYGGAGGDCAAGTAGGIAWGDPSIDDEMQHPDELGSDGRSGYGGGAIRLVASDALTIAGTVIANGNNGSGGGSGGSIWLNCDTLAGAGTVETSGGNGGGGGGGGGGGRIAIYYNTDSSTITLDSNCVAPGAGNGAGEDGQYGTLWVNTALVFTNLWMGKDHGGADWIISTNTLSIGGTHYNVGTFQVDSNVTATLVRGTKLWVTATNINIYGTLDAKRRGYFTSQGSPGDGGTGGDNRGGGGGGYGGVGGNGEDYPGWGAGGTNWGNPSITDETLYPDEWGSAGGHALSPGRGGSGGGAIRLVTRGVLTVDGVVTAEGQDGQTGGDDGNAGGAGGSIWLDCGAITGSGTVTAAGGDSQQNAGQGGGGGGGRIAIYCRGTVGVTINISGGAGRGGGTAGADGTYCNPLLSVAGTVIVLR